MMTPDREGLHPSGEQNFTRIRGVPVRLYIRTEATIARADPSDYVRPLEIDVRCWDEETDEEHLVARLAADHVLWGDALTDDVPLFEVCDNDSEGMHQLHLILSEGTNEFRDDLEIEEPVDAVIFVHRAVFHPDVRPYRVGILDAVFNLFGHLSLAVMWRETGDTPEKEQVQLGLARVAGTGLVFRHNARVTPYSQAHPLGMDDDAEGSAETERWVLAEWMREDEGEPAAE